MATTEVPDYDDLPTVEGMPKGCAWGVFDKDGKKDLVGTLNFLTPDRVRAAAAEVKDGVSISLSLPLNQFNDIPFLPREDAAHKVMSIQEAGLAPAHGFDDVVSFNTQCSTQWDSLVHWQHQPSGRAYNGLKPTKELLSVDKTADNTMPTLDHWHERGGVVGRGVLIDYLEYARAKGLDYDPLRAYRITIEDIENVAKHQGLVFQPGDIFLIRTGFGDSVLDKGGLGAFQGLQGGITGVHGSGETARWFWNRRFAAVACDTPAFEAYPPVNEDGSPRGEDGLVLHSYFLSLFGMHIGEFWNLRELGDYCKKAGRYSFMLTSSPLNIPCLVGSPPNALAVL